MKRLFSMLLSIIMVCTAVAPLSAAAQAVNPIVEYSFESVSGTKVSNTARGGSSSLTGSLRANAKVVNDKARGNVLYLDGSAGTCMMLPKGFFDNRNQMTISMDVKSLMDDGNFFTFAYGSSVSKYAFLRVRGYESCFIVARDGNRDENYAGALKTRTGKWHTITVVIDNGTTNLYINGVKAATGMRNGEGITTSELGTGLFGYVGKSFYANDEYFKGYYDNIRIYDRALSDSEVVDCVYESVPLISDVIAGTTVSKDSKGTDNHTASGAVIDNENMTITPYIRRGASPASVPVRVSCIASGATLKVDGAAFTSGSSLDLRKDRRLSVTFRGRTQAYTLRAAEIAYNAALPGQYADPDIDYFDGKYWIFPTTDGYDWWSGTQFHAFSSTDLQSWTDEGVVLDVADKSPGKNAKGVQIASCPWSDVNAWAPSVEAKNGKYYLYFCGNYTKTNRMAIGVAVASRPAGPYTVKDVPLISDDTPVGDNTPLYVNGDTEVDGIFRGQTIDPSIFTEDNGTSYILFGNGTPALFRLNSDMMSVDASSYCSINQGNGLPNFCESVYCIKRNGIYHFTWSCYGTDDERYQVGYGTAASLTGPVTYRYTLMKENEEIGALCTAHQSFVYRKDIDKCYIAYHRFYTPLGIYTDQYGKHRETCVDEITFSSSGLMNQKKPTMTGISLPASRLSATLSSTAYTYDGTAKTPTVTLKDSSGNAINARNYTVSYSNNINAGTATATIRVSGKYTGTISKTFRINPKSASGLKVSLSKTAYEYDGKAKKPAVTVKTSSGKKIASTEGYSVKYSSNTRVGKAKAVITFKGNYSGTATREFVINPKGTTISDIKASKKALTVKWKKQATQITGYEIQYSTDKGFKKASTIKIGSVKATSKKITGLKAKKKYYVRIRTYTSVKGTKYCSGWSAVKNAKTK